MQPQSRKAVAPVLATLLMIAVAVAMSVIIFMWSQGFLSQTSSATGAQQGSQNVAAQSSISVETVVANTATPSITIIIRNVGAVSVNLGTYVVTGLTANAGFKAALSGQTTTLTQSPANCATTLAKGSACSLTLSTGLTGLTSGDVISIKVTTTAGTFATQEVTIP